MFDTCDRDNDDDMLEDKDHAMGIIGSLGNVGELQSEMLLGEIGVSRRCQGSARVLVLTEIYSPPRVTNEIKEMRHKYVAPVLGLDLTVIDPFDGQPWDFDRPEKRKREDARSFGSRDPTC